MHDDPITPRALIRAVLRDLAADSESVVLISSALDHQASGVSSNAQPQKLRETAALVKSAALALGTAAANLVGSAERLRLVADLGEIAEADGGDLPS